MQVPETMKALVLRENKGDGLHDAVLEIRPVPRPSTDQVVVKVRAVAFNHRDVCPDTSVPSLALKLTMRSYPRTVVVDKKESISRYCFR